VIRESSNTSISVMGSASAPPISAADAGIYVSGAKVVATNSALTHYNFLGQGGAAIPTHDTDLAVMFIARMNAPGATIPCSPMLNPARAIGCSPGTRIAASGRS
jgi:aromatic ring hydroxylase